MNDESEIFFDNHQKITQIFLFQIFHSYYMIYNECIMIG